jgi:hypothetical protein
MHRDSLRRWRVAGATARFFRRFAMTIQISNFHVSDRSKITGSGAVSLLPNRKDAAHSGTFKIKVDVAFDPAVNDYPTGSLSIDVDLTDSFKGSARSTSIEQVNSFGKHTPTAVITGRCKVDASNTPIGCGFWLLIANNKRPNQQGTPDVVGFVIYDRNGDRVAYGTGPLEGDMEVLAAGL